MYTWVVLSEYCTCCCGPCFLWYNVTCIMIATMVLTVVLSTGCCCLIVDVVAVFGVKVSKVVYIVVVL